MKQAKRTFTYTVAACIYMLASASLLARFSPQHNEIILPVILVPSFAFLFAGLFGGRK